MFDIPIDYKLIKPIYFRRGNSNSKMDRLDRFWYSVNKIFSNFKWFSKLEILNVTV